MHDLEQQAVNAEITVSLRGKALPVVHRCLGLPTAFKHTNTIDVCVFCRNGAEYSIQRHANCPFGTITEQRICIDFARTVIVASSTVHRTDNGAPQMENYQSLSIYHAIILLAWFLTSW
ncbi:hypothetical protein D917_10625 [Trichinella nativa]|uniref:Uncharacterized protein n=1 Tax=Trichinella nativa TaxID=6335 RepID=A0A1Y3E9U5_9BILA|nr:hypothetical protein D917_10625 [Trichinella nativa]